MSVRILIFFCCCLMSFISCKEISREARLSLYSEKEKDSISNYFNEVSSPSYIHQPSDFHRSLKDSALFYNPHNISARQKLSYSYKKVGDHITAMQVLNKAAELDTLDNKASVLQYRAWTLLYFYRDYEGTIRDVDSIKKITGNNYNVCWGEPCDFHKGQALYKLSRYDEAVQTFNELNAHETELGFDINDNTLVFFYMGRCYAEKNQHRKAIEFYEKSLLSNPKFPEAYYQMGLSYKSLGQTLKAKENFTIAYDYKIYKLQEPYIERFDEVFPYMIERELEDLE